MNPPGMLSSVRQLLEWIGEDPDREGLKETPNRYLEAWKFWTSGYGKDPAEILKVFEDGSENYSELVFQGNIAMHSLCEHHLAPFYGVVHIGYIPDGRIIGLSKLARLVEIFARRLQVQERLGCQIADALMDNISPIAVGVVLQCRHLCMESRGVQKIGTVTTTSVLRGGLKDSMDARAEFMTLVQIASQKGNI